MMLKIIVSDFSYRVSNSQVATWMTPSHGSKPSKLGFDERLFVGQLVNVDPGRAR